MSLYESLDNSNRIYVVTLFAISQTGNPDEIVESMAFKTQADAETYERNLENEYEDFLAENGTADLYIQRIESILNEGV